MGGEKPEDVSRAARHALRKLLAYNLKFDTVAQCAIAMTELGKGYKLGREVPRTRCQFHVQFYPCS